MCFTAIIINRNGEKLGALGWGVLMNTLHYAYSNPHGFAIRVDDKVVMRTLDIDKYKNFIINSRSEIEDSMLVHVHYRYATSGRIDENNIHLWKVGRYYASHNGSIPGYGNMEISDSLSWFLENEEDIEKEDLDALANSSSEAWGVFLLSKEDMSKLMIGSAGKPIQVQLLDDVIILSSAKVDYKPSLTTTEVIDIYGFSFTIKKKIASLPKPKRILKTTIENEWRLIDLVEKKLLKKAIVHRSYVYSYSYYTLPYSYSYDDDCKGNNCKVKRISWGDDDE